MMLVPMSTRDEPLAMSANRSFVLKMTLKKAASQTHLFEQPIRIKAVFWSRAKSHATDIDLHDNFPVPKQITARDGDMEKELGGGHSVSNGETQAQTNKVGQTPQRGMNHDALSQM